ncbi:hypothetical protein [Listeria booriae]|uniref:Uncharacterized protein n=1 Tax=Listeria booriae TaxID=1552123 RepID=A0A841XZI4_9LIST|nr:hypothetical protein [Listeria booriae]MBC1316607.1 hypothetical protein [Listeria booriae]
MNMIKGHSYREYRSLLNNRNDTQIADKWNVSHAELSNWKQENGIYITHSDVKMLKLYRHIRKLAKMGYDRKKICKLMQITTTKYDKVLNDYEGVE